MTVVDDDADVLDLFSDVLHESGYIVETLSDALPGIEDLVRSQPSLIIVDMLLDPHREQLTGLQLIHSARSSEELRDVPIIVCTADLPGLETAWPELSSRGDVHKLEKPFDLDTLDQVLAVALGRGTTEDGFRGTRGRRQAPVAGIAQGGDCPRPSNGEPVRGRNGPATPVTRATPPANG